jgi:DNA polymerase-1
VKRLILVDVSAQFFRAFYAIRDLRTSKGFPTNALYGFLTMTVKLLKTYEPRHMVFCLDTKEGSFRTEIDSTYKANRTEMPEDLAKQLPYIFKLTEALGIPQMKKADYEADDLIGSLAVWGEKKGGFDEVKIISGDKDFSQLINETITMHDTMKNKIYTPEEVYKKWEVYPEQFIDYLSIVGDSSDNISGIRGIGAKGAAKLLKDYKSLDGIYENLDKIKGATLKKLEEGREDAQKSKELVTIVTDLDLVKDESDITLKDVDLEELEKILSELEFDSFLKNFKQVNSESVDEPTKKSVEIKDVKDFKKHFKDSEASLEVLNTERGDYLFNEKNSFTLPHDPEELEKIGAHIKKENFSFSGFDIKPVLKKLGLTDVNLDKEMQLMCYSLSSEAWTFKSAYKEFCDKEVTEFFGGSDYRSAYDELKRSLESKLVDESLKLYEEIEKPLFNILLKMESEGVLIDKDYLNSFSEELDLKINNLTKEAHSLVEKPFNLASPKQLAKVLFEDIGLKPIKKTKTGFSTNTEVLEKLKDEHPLPSLVIDFREWSKLKSTYVDALPKLINPKTGRVHTTYNQALTATGRLSSTSPNLQNIPIRTEQGRRVREAFIAKKDHFLVSADYSQIELRVLAHISKDKGLTEAFEKGQDVHARTAAEIFEVDLDKVSSDQRRTAKAVNFGIAYGQGAYGLSEALNIGRKEAKEIIERYFQRFSGVQDYIETTKEQAHKDGYVLSLLGRKRIIKELSSSNKMMKSFGERAAINAPIQGTASDLIKLAMVEVDKRVKSALLMQVHDELIFSVKESEVEDQANLIKDIMESAYKLNVPLVANVSWGKNWNEAH